MKKVFIFISTILTCLLMSVPPLLAESQNNIGTGLTSKIIYSSPEITDNNELYKRAKSGISDGPVKFHPNEVIKKDGVVIPGDSLKHYTTVEKLKDTEYNDSISHKEFTKSSYKQTTFTAIPKSFLEKEDNQEVPKKQNLFGIASLNLRPISVASLTDPSNDYDDSISVYSINTIYYDYITVDDSYRAYRMTKIVSRWDNLDSQVVLGDHFQKWYQQGTGYDSSGNEIPGGKIIGDVNEDISTTSGKNYTMYTYSDIYIKLLPENVGDPMYSAQSIILTRGGSSWDFSIFNSFDPN